VKRHADLKEAFYARVRAETHRTPEVEKRLREDVARLKASLKAARASEAGARSRAEHLVLTAAVRTRRHGAQGPPVAGQQAARLTGTGCRVGGGCRRRSSGIFL
jgi:hypothetical protein